MPTNSPRPFQLTYPLNARQVEEIDSMFQRLFSKLPLGVERGGTGLGFGAILVGDLLYGDVDALNNPILSTLTAGAVGKYLRSGGLFTAPLWSTLVLTDTAAVGDILIGSTLDNVTGLAIGGAGTILRSTGTLPAWSGFTIPNTFAQGDLPYASATNVLSALTKSTTATHYLSNTGSSNNPAWAQINLANGVTSVLPVANGGTNKSSWVIGDIAYATGATTIAGLAISTSNNGSFLRSNGSAPFWSTLTIPNTATTGGVFHASATSVGTFLAIGAVGTVLRSTGTLPEWGAVNLASAAAITGDLPDANLSANVPLINGTNAFTGANSFASNVLNLLSGQLAFPSTQNASSDVNTLDDYEEGTWTPAITFATPGNLSVAYSTQVGTYVKIGNMVRVNANIVTSTFTHTTATGDLQITGLPFTSQNLTSSVHVGGTAVNGFTFPAGYTSFMSRIAPNSVLGTFIKSGSAVANTTFTDPDHITGTAAQLTFTTIYATET